MNGQLRDGRVEIAGNARQQFYDARGYGTPAGGNSIDVSRVEAAHLCFAVISSRFSTAMATVWISRHSLSPPPRPSTALRSDFSSTPNSVIVAFISRPPARDGPATTAATGPI